MALRALKICPKCVIGIVGALKTIHITGQSAKTAPFVIAPKAIDGGICQTRIAMTVALASPASEDCHAGRRKTPRQSKTVAIGMIATKNAAAGCRQPAATTDETWDPTLTTFLMARLNRRTFDRRTRRLLHPRTSCSYTSLWRVLLR
jgi:hypothetical protein